MKKRTLAILLIALLAVSAVLVLAACNKEYTVTFREANGKKLEEVTTVKGMATASEKTTTKAGYTFEGWYKTVGQDDEGRYTFKDKVDLTKEVFTEDTDLYANWTRNISRGEEEGYCLIGIIGGVTNWDPEVCAEDENLQLTNSNNPINLYTKTLDLMGLDEFKVKTSYKDWDTKEINYGGEKVTKITKGASATLPAGVEKVEDLFNLGGNIQVLCAMNVTVNFYYAGKTDSYIEIVVNSTTGDIVKPVAETGIILAGLVKNGTEWAQKLDPNDATQAKYIFATEDKKVWTLTGVELPLNTGFKFKVNENGWGRGEWGRGKLMEVTFADDVTTLPEGITAENAADVFGGDSQNEKGDIKALYAMTINVKFTLATGEIEIEVTQIDPTLPEEPEFLEVELVGTVNGVTDWNNGVKMTGIDAQTAKLENVSLKAGDSFKVRSIGTWDGSVNQGGWGVLNGTVTLAAGLQLPGGASAVEYFFAGTKDSGNVVVAHDCTATITFSTTDHKFVILITALESESPVEGEAKIGNTSYATLLEAIEAVENGETIVLQKDVVSGGIFLGEGSRNFTIDLNNHTLTIGKPLVGSTGTVSQSIHLEKGNTVVFKNGTITSEANSASMLVQNYCNLTLDNVTLDGSKLAGEGTAYTLSNNFGTILIKGGSNIIARETKGIAFDLWYGMFAQYDEGLSVTVEAGCTIQGRIEYGAASRIEGTDWVEKAALVLPAGEYTIVYTSTGITADNDNITIGTADAEA